MSNPSWKRLAHAAALRAERALDAARRRLPARPTDLHIHPYIGHGNAESVVLRGRVLADPPPDPDAPDGHAVRRAWRTFRRFASRELPGVELTVSLDGDRVTVVTDQEGYYEARLPATPGGVRRFGTASSAGHSVEVEAVVPDAATGSVLVVSDIDDTVLETGAQRAWDVARATIFGTYRTRTPVPAMAEFYRGLVRGPDGEMENTTFYVSSSPWNLYDFLATFLEFRGLPHGPLFLRDLGIDKSRFIASGHATHKRAAIDEILTMHAAHRALLVGDTGQRDPEIYAEVAREQPERIAAIYLRDVAGAERDAEVNEIGRELAGIGVPLVRSRSAVAFAEHALTLGLIAPDDAAAVARAVEAAPN